MFEFFTQYLLAIVRINKNIVFYNQVAVSIHINCLYTNSLQTTESSVICALQRIKFSPPPPLTFHPPPIIGATPKVFFMLQTKSFFKLNSY